MCDAPYYKGSEKLKDKAALITGGDSGIGRSVAILFAREGADVAIAYLDEHEDAEETKRLVEAEGRKCLLIPGDVTSREYCFDAIAKAVKIFGKIDVLVNNAGILGRHRAETKQGFEMSFGVNYLGAFLLTMLLLPLLEKSEQGRVVMTTSIAHGWGDVRFDDLNYTHGYNRFAAYGHSKLCCLLFTRALAEKLRAKGSRVTVNAVHPGIVATDIVVNRANDRFRWVASAMKILFMTSDEGAATGVCLASDPALNQVSGEYFYRCKVEPSSAVSKNLASANRLYDVSLKLCGVADDPLLPPPKRISV